MSRSAAPPPHSNGLYTHPNTHVRVDSGKPVAQSWLNGQGALVFGGATGAGAAVVKALAEAGAYVTIADSAANEGQRLMLECVGRNLRRLCLALYPLRQNKYSTEFEELNVSSVQYIYTNLPIFRSQAEAIHYAAVFSPTATISVVICSTVPPPTTPRSPHLSLLSWLRTTTDDSVFPNPIPAPPTTPLDRAVTATYHAVHHTLHHFRQSPPLIPRQQQPSHVSHGHQGHQSMHPLDTSASPKSVPSSSPRSHGANMSPTSFKTAGTSTSASAQPSHAPPPPPPPALPLDPSTALHAHPIRHRENGETSTSPTVPTGPAGFLTLPALPSPVASTGPDAEEDLTALPLPQPSPSSPIGALDESMHALPLMAMLPANERKHLVVLAPDSYLLASPDDDADTPIDGNDSASVYDSSDRATGRAHKPHNKLPPHQLAERAAAAGLRALVESLQELCETDAVGQGISVGCVGWGEDSLDAVEKTGDADGGDQEGLLANAADRRCVRGVMRLLCGSAKGAADPTAAAAAGDEELASAAFMARGGPAALLGSVDRNAGAGDILVTQEPTLLASPTLLSTSSVTDVEADADDELEGDGVDDEEDSSSTTSTDLILAARSVVAPSPLDRPTPGAAAGAAGRGNAVPALGQLREEEEGEQEGEEICALPPVATMGGGKAEGEEKDEGEEKGDGDSSVKEGAEAVKRAADVVTPTADKIDTAKRNTTNDNDNKMAVPEKPAEQTKDPPIAANAAKRIQDSSVSASVSNQKPAASLLSPDTAAAADTTKPLPPLPIIAPTTTPPPSRADDLTAEPEPELRGDGHGDGDENGGAKDEQVEQVEQGERDQEKEEGEKAGDGDGTVGGDEVKMGKEDEEEGEEEGDGDGDGGDGEQDPIPRASTASEESETF